MSSALMSEWSILHLCNSLRSLATFRHNRILTLSLDFAVFKKLSSVPSKEYSITNAGKNEGTVRFITVPGQSLDVRNIGD